MKNVTSVILLLLFCANIKAFPASQTEEPADGEDNDEDATKNSLGHSVVTSVSVVMNGKEPQFTDAIGKFVPRPMVPPQVASPINLLNPDRYEFYTFNDNGELEKRLMTMKEIQSIVAGGDGDGTMMMNSFPPNYSDPEEKVQDIVNSVQSVLTQEMESNKNKNQTNLLLDTPDVSSSWSMILPAIFGNTGDEIVPPNHKPQQVVMTPDADLYEATEHITPIYNKTYPSSTRKPVTSGSSKRPVKITKKPTTLAADTFEEVIEDESSTIVFKKVSLITSTVKNNYNEGFTEAVNLKNIDTTTNTPVTTTRKFFRKTTPHSTTTERLSLPPKTTTRKIYTTPKKRRRPSTPKSTTERFTTTELPTTTTTIATTTTTTLLPSTTEEETIPTTIYFTTSTTPVATTTTKLTPAPTTSTTATTTRTTTTATTTTTTRKSTTPEPTTTLTPFTSTYIPELLKTYEFTIDAITTTEIPITTADYTTIAEPHHFIKISSNLRPALTTLRPLDEEFTKTNFVKLSASSSMPTLEEENAVTPEEKITITPEENTTIAPEETTITPEEKITVTNDELLIIFKNAAETTPENNYETSTSALFTEGKLDSTTNLPATSTMLAETQNAINQIIESLQDLNSNSLLTMSDMDLRTMKFEYTTEIEPTTTEDCEKLLPTSKTILETEIASSNVFKDNQLYVEEDEPIVSDLPTTPEPTTTVQYVDSTTEYTTKRPDMSNIVNMIDQIIADNKDNVQTVDVVSKPNNKVMPVTPAGNLSMLEYIAQAATVASIISDADNVIDSTTTENNFDPLVSFNSVLSQVVKEQEEIEEKQHKAQVEDKFNLLESLSLKKAPVDIQAETESTDESIKSSTMHSTESAKVSATKASSVETTTEYILEKRNETMIEIIKNATLIKIQNKIDSLTFRTQTENTKVPVTETTTFTNKLPATLLKVQAQLVQKMKLEAAKLEALTTAAAITTTVEIPTTNTEAQNTIVIEETTTPVKSEELTTIEKPAKVIENVALADEEQTALDKIKEEVTTTTPEEAHKDEDDETNVVQEILGAIGTINDATTVEVDTNIEDDEETETETETDDEDDDVDEDDDEDDDNEEDETDNPIQAFMKQVGLIPDNFNEDSAEKQSSTSNEDDDDDDDDDENDENDENEEEESDEDTTDSKNNELRVNNLKIKSTTPSVYEDVTQEPQNFKEATTVSSGDISTVSFEETYRMSTEETSDEISSVEPSSAETTSLAGSTKEYEEVTTTLMDQTTITSHPVVKNILEKISSGESLIVRKDDSQEFASSEHKYVKLGETTASPQYVAALIRGIIPEIVEKEATTKPLDQKTLNKKHFSNSRPINSKISPLKGSSLQKQSSASRIPPVLINLSSAPKSALGLLKSIEHLNEDIKEFTQLCNEIAFNFYRTIIEADDISSARSVVVSPFAASSMLAMVFLGARGGTSGEMNELLRLDDMVTFNPHMIFKNITESVQQARHSGIVTAAFVRELFSEKSKGKLLQFYKEKAQQFYSGHVEEVNFGVVNDVIRRRTNMLVKRYSHGKVMEYLKTNNIWLNPPLAAVSANIFQTDCSEATVNERDGEMFFQVSPEVRQRQLVPIPAAVWRSGFTAGYDHELDATAVAFGDNNNIVSTIFVMPGQQGHSIPGDSLQRLENTIYDTSNSLNVWSRLLTTLIERPGLEIQIPRFSHRSLINATSGLQKLGLKDIFNSNRADLRGLTGSTATDLFFSDMLQINTFSTCAEDKVGDQHHIEIYPSPALKRNFHYNKQNSYDDLSYIENMKMNDPQEYQRALYDPIYDTKYLEIPLSLRPRQARLPEAPRLKFDRPFLYFVRHNPTGMILYMGRFNPRLQP